MCVCVCVFVCVSVFVFVCVRVFVSVCVFCVCVYSVLDFPQLSLDTEFIYSASQWRVFKYCCVFDNTTWISNGIFK